MEPYPRKHKARLVKLFKLAYSAAGRLRLKSVLVPGPYPWCSSSRGIHKALTHNGRIDRSEITRSLFKTGHGNPRIHFFDPRVLLPPALIQFWILSPIDIQQHRTTNTNNFIRFRTFRPIVRAKPRQLYSCSSSLSGTSKIQDKRAKTRLASLSLESHHLGITLSVSASGVASFQCRR